MNLKLVNVVETEITGSAQGGQDLQMPTISGILNAALENVFDSGPFTESCLGYKAGKRESGHLACSLGGGQPGGSLVHHQYLNLIVALLEAANQEVAIVHFESILALLYSTYHHLTL